MVVYTPGHLSEAKDDQLKRLAYEPTWGLFTLTQGVVTYMSPVEVFTRYLIHKKCAWSLDRLCTLLVLWFSQFGGDRDQLSRWVLVAWFNLSDYPLWYHVKYLWTVWMISSESYVTSCCWSILPRWMPVLLALVLPLNASTKLEP